MADFYCDVSAIGNEYQVYADTPTWGAVSTDKPLPQDGNGKAGPGHAAAVAIGTIDCTAASASGAGILGLFGATISSTLTGSGSTLATNIVAAINACAAATTSTYSALLLPLKYFVFARIDPANANIVQIAHRIAGVDWNGMVCTTAGTWGTAPTMGAFAGGANGPFGYWVHNAAVFGKAVGAYGLIASTTAAVTAYLITDPIHFRAARSGVAVTMTFDQAAAMSIGITTSANIVIDNSGEVWTGDTGVVTINVSCYAASGVQYFFYSATGFSIYLVCSIDSGLVINLTNTYTGGTASFNVFAPYNGVMQFVNVLVEVKTNHVVEFFHRSNAPNVVFLVRSHLIARQKVYMIPTGGSIVNITAVDSVFEWVGAGQDVAVFLNSVLSANSCYMSMTGCKFVVDSGAYKVNAIANAGGNIYSLANISLENCDGIAAVDFAWSVGVPWKSSYLYKNLNGDFRYKTPLFAVDRIIANTYPALSAVDAMGNTGTVQVSIDPARVGSYLSIKLLSLRAVNRGGAIARTLTVEMLCPDSVALLKSHLVLRVQYTDSGGVFRQENTRGTGALDAGVGLGSWTLNGATGRESKKLTLTTAYPVAAGSEISGVIFAEDAPPSSVSVYVNPELL